MARPPDLGVRQTDEGSLLLGASQEDRGFDTSVLARTSRDIAHRAVRVFPCLAALRVVRTWGALRVMTPDGFPIYDRSQTHPGAFVFTCHSGVTLAANRRFPTSRRSWLEVEEILAAPPCHSERRPGLEFIGVKSVFQDKTAGDVPMKRFDVLLALGRAVVPSEALQGGGLI